MNKLSEKVDGLAKGYKRHTTSALFIALAGALATKGIDVSLYTEAVEVVYGSVMASYAAIMTVLKAISKDG